MHCSDGRSDMRKLAVPFAHLTGMPVSISAGKTEESGHSHQKTIWVSILEERGCRNGGSLQGCPMAPCCSLSCPQQCYSSSLSCPLLRHCINPPHLLHLPAPPLMEHSAANFTLNHGMCFLLLSYL